VIVEPQEKFYVTTPIYYVSARPHLGSLYSTLLADVVARWQKLQGKKVLFVTGTDEHGQKIVQAAERANKEVRAFVDDLVPTYKKTWQTYSILYDHFVRTVDAYHVMGAQHFIATLIKKGAIYRGVYEGWYCTPCETFVTEKDRDEGAPDVSPRCPSCQRLTNQVSEKTYFFKLSLYQDKLLRFYQEHPDFIVPKERFNEVISFVQSGLKDLSISRATVAWGVPFPDDPGHTVYVWAEALCNYITSIGYGSANKQQQFSYWWPVDLQVIGKDIVRFHAVYWPAFLMAAGLSLPKKLLVHGWIKINEEKMSKSRGNIVDPIVLHKAYGTDVVRYFLLRKIPVNQDGSFSIQALERCIETDLANDLGNLLQRMVVLAHKHDLFEVSAPSVWSKKSLNLRDIGRDLIKDFAHYMENYSFHGALSCAWAFIKRVNGFFHEHKPWELGYDTKSKVKFAEIISATCHSLRIIAVLLWPVMPNKMEALLARLGIVFVLNNNMIKDIEQGEWTRSFALKKGSVLFVKPLSSSVRNNMVERTGDTDEKQIESSTITIDDFTKVSLVAGTIVSCDEVPQSSKLVSLTVDFGACGRKQILAGIKKWYGSEELVGVQAIFVYNLKSRSILGMKSEGMLLSAQDATGKLRIAMLEGLVPNGTQLQ